MTAVGLSVPQLGGAVDRTALRTFCARAEALGFASLWVQEHLFYPRKPTSDYAARPGIAVPEAYRTTLSVLETLAMVAAWTERATIGTSILVAGYHRPVELAQRLGTIDLLSGGRLVAGFSVGWSDDEHQQMDIDPRTRGAWCDELIDALLTCWAPDPVSFDGRFFSIPESDVRPKPVQRPRPRLLSGMRSGPGLRRTAEKFDIWNPASGSLEQIMTTAEEIRSMRPAGLPPLEVYLRTFTEPPIRAPHLRPLSVPELCDQVRQAKAAGFDAVIVDPNFDPALATADDWAKVPDRLAPLVEAAA